MTRFPAVAKLVGRAPDILPDDVGPGVLCLQRLRQSGLIGRLEGWLPLSRHGGYTVTTIFAALTVFLLAGPARGIRPFLSQLDGCIGRRVAAVVGRRAIPSASSLSRALWPRPPGGAVLSGQAVGGTGFGDEHPRPPGRPPSRCDRQRVARDRRGSDGEGHAAARPSRWAGVLRWAAALPGRGRVHRPETRRGTHACGPHDP